MVHTGNLVDSSVVAAIVVTLELIFDNTSY